MMYKQFFVLILVLFALISTGYSLTNINSCSNLNVAGETYEMNGSILNSATTNCMDITANNVTFDCKGYTIDGNDAASYGIRVYRASTQVTNVTIKNCIVSDFDNTNIYLRSAYNNTLENITSFSSDQYGLSLETAYYNNVSNSNFSSNAIVGVSISSSNSNNFYNNVINFNSLQAVSFSVSTSNIFRNSLFSSSSSTAVSFFISSSNIFINNTFFNNSKIATYSSSSNNRFNGTGIGNLYLTTTNTGASDICSDLDSNGICDGGVYYIGGDLTSIDYFPRAKIVGQNYSSNIDSCVGIISSGIYNLSTNITNSAISSCIDVTANNATFNCNGYTIDGNDAVDYGIRISRAIAQATNVTIKDCIVSDFTNGNLYLFSAHNNTLQNITSFSSAQYGLNLNTANYNNITNSNFSNNTNSGVILQAATYNFFENSFFNNNNAYGVTFGASSSSNTFINNVVSSNSLYGFYFNIAGSNIIYNNTFNNTFNFYLSNSNNNKFNNSNIGNLYLNPFGTGVSEICGDANSNGICDTSGYFIDVVSTNVDYLPRAKIIGQNYVNTLNNCTAIITSGSYELGANITNSAISSCIDIMANNVTFDCKGNIIDGNDGASYGIKVYRPSAQVTNVTIKNCIISDFNTGDIYLFSAYNNTLNNITSFSSNQYGLNLYAAYYTNISNSNFSNNANYGTYIEQSSYCFIQNNLFNNNAQSGLLLSFSSNNQVRNNFFQNNANSGLYFSQSNLNTIQNNTIQNNTQYGLYFTSSSLSSVYYNIINNSNNAVFFFSSNNRWNTTSAGNFWAYPNGSGFSQTCTDANLNNICDTNYTIASGNIDYFPLVSLNLTYDPNPTPQENSSNSTTNSTQVSSVFPIYGVFSIIFSFVLLSTHFIFA